MASTLKDKEQLKRNRAYFEDNNFTGGLCYPLDIAEGRFYKEAISFQILQRDGISLNKVIQNIGNPIRDSIAAAKVVNAEQSGIVDTLVGAFTSKEDANNAIMAELQSKNGGRAIGTNIYEVGKIVVDGIGKIVRKHKLEPDIPKERLIGSILLNMPASVQYNEKIDWESRDLGLVGGLFNKDSGFSVGSAAKSAGMANVGSMAGGAAGAIISKMFGTSGLAGTAIGAVVAGDGPLQGAIDSTFNIKQNPFKEQTFQGIGFRPFEFSFTFRARSPEEMNAIQKIITIFRGFSKPSFDTRTESGSFSYPKEFRIQFLKYVGDSVARGSVRRGATFKKGSDKMDYQRLETNTFIPEIKYCICTGVNTNFTGSGGWNSFKDGAPVDITLQLTFEETEIITQDDVFGETQVGTFKGKGGNF